MAAGTSASFLVNNSIVAATDFKMTADYYATLSEVEQLELTTKIQ